jgi:hypothetical protein
MIDPPSWAPIAVSGVSVIVSATAIWFAGKNSTKAILLSRKLDKVEASRHRLDIATIHWPPTGLQLDLRYDAEFHHVGLKARVALLSPEGGYLKQLRRVSNPAPINGSYSRLEQGSSFIGEGIVRLVCDTIGQPFTGSLLIIAPQGTTKPLRKARIRVRIETDNDDLLLDQELAVGPIEQAEQFWTSAPSNLSAEELAAILKDSPLNEPYPIADGDPNSTDHRHF